MLDGSQRKQRLILHFFRSRVYYPSKCAPSIYSSVLFKVLIMHLRCAPIYCRCSKCWFSMSLLLFLQFTLKVMTAIFVAVFWFSRGRSLATRCRALQKQAIKRGRGNRLCRSEKIRTKWHIGSHLWRCSWTTVVYVRQVGQDGLAAFAYSETWKFFFTSCRERACRWPTGWPNPLLNHQ